MGDVFNTFAYIFKFHIPGTILISNIFGWLMNVPINFGIVVIDVVVIVCCEVIFADTCNEPVAGAVVVVASKYSVKPFDELLIPRGPVAPVFVAVPGIPSGPV